VTVITDSSTTSEGRDDSLVFHSFKAGRCKLERIETSVESA
jgi:hypothetical protein